MITRRSFLAAASTAGNAAAVPAIIAGANPAYADAAKSATILVAASVVITAILVPLVTAFVAKKFGSPKALEMKDVKLKAAQSMAGAQH